MLTAYDPAAMKRASEEFPEAQSNSPATPMKPLQAPMPALFLPNRKTFAR